MTCIEVMFLGKVTQWSEVPRHLKWYKVSKINFDSPGSSTKIRISSDLIITHLSDISTTTVLLEQ